MDSRVGDVANYRKDRVLAYLEEDSRQIGEENEELSQDYLAALSVLEAVSIIAKEQNENQAVSDIKELLHIVNKQ